MHRVSFSIRAESPPIFGQESNVEKFQPFPPLSSPNLNLVPDTFSFFIYQEGRKIRLDVFIRCVSSIVQRRSIRTNHFQFSLYLGYKYNVFSSFPSLPFSHPLPFFFYTFLWYRRPIVFNERKLEKNPPSATARDREVGEFAGRNFSDGSCVVGGESSVTRMAKVSAGTGAAPRNNWFHRFERTIT